MLSDVKEQNDEAPPGLNREGLRRESRFAATYVDPSEELKLESHSAVNWELA